MTCDSFQCLHFRFISALFPSSVVARIRLVRKGIGSAPNVYKGIARESAPETQVPEQQEFQVNVNLQ